MKKKVLCLLIGFVSLFVFNNSVYATDQCDSGHGVDHSLNYEIQSFTVDEDSNLTISGWALIHNCHNWGNISSSNNSYHSNNVNYDDLNYGNAGYIVYFAFESSSGIIFDKDTDGNHLFVADFVDGADFTDDFCYKSSGGTCFDSSFVYKNVGFTITINLNDIGLDYGTWNLMIGAVNHKMELLEDLAVASDVAENSNNSNSDLKIEIQATSDTADVSGNHVVLDGSIYWKMTTGIGDEYTIKSVSSGGDYNIFTLYHDYGDVYSSENVVENCGWSYNDDLDGGRRCTTTYGSYYHEIKGIFVKVKGAVRLKIQPNDHVCSVSNDTIDGCTGGSADKICSKMTVTTDDTPSGKKISAVIRLSERVSLISGEDSDFVDEYNSYFGGDYSNYQVVKGRMFHYALIYKDVVYWNFVESDEKRAEKYAKASLSLDEGDALINKVVKEGEYLKDFISRYNAIGDDGSSNFNIININGDYGFGSSSIGDWVCSRSDQHGSTDKINMTDPSAASYKTYNNTYTTTCKYQFKHLYVKNNVTKYYNNEQKIDGEVVTLGRNFYIPMGYSDAKFSWSVSGSDLSTLKVRYLNGSPNVQKLISVDANSSSGVCNINVIGPNDSGDTATGGSTNPWWSETVEDSLYVYRSVSTKDPFPKGEDTIPKNWENPDYRSRLGASYDNLDTPDYSIDVDDAMVTTIGNLNDIYKLYTSWDDTKLTSGGLIAGSNDIVTSPDFNFNPRGNYCVYGLFNDTCDKRIGG